MLCALAMAITSSAVTGERLDWMWLKWMPTVRSLMAAINSSFVFTTTTRFARRANLMVEVVAMSGQDDELALGKAASVGDFLLPLVVVFGIHAVIAAQDLILFAFRPQ